MDPRTDAIIAAGSGRKRRLAAQRVWYLTLSLFFGSVLVSAIVSTLAVWPGYCALCHNDVRAALKTSGHATVSCDDCHTKPGIFGVVDSRLAIVGMVPAKLAGGGYDIRSVENDGCLACHAKELAGTVSVDGLRMSHRAVIEADRPCTKCHTDAAHGSAASYNAGFTMDMCLQCHTTNYKDLETCSTCHTGGSFPQQARGRTPWRVTHGPDWRKTHGMGDLATCKSCHPGDYCVRCHNMVLPHPPNFTKTHGVAVMAGPASRADCQTCHRAGACDDCHGIAMPHPDGFIRTHVETVKAKGKALCFRCHDKASCTACHARHVHPGIPPDQLEQLQARPVTP